jgi:mRNA interferase HigB
MERAIRLQTAKGLDLRIIAKSRLVGFWYEHPETEQPLKAWHNIAKTANWQSPLDVTNNLRTVKAVSKDRVRFEICGGNYRLIVAFKFSANIAFVKFIGTHKEYDRVDAKTVSQF